MQGRMLFVLLQALVGPPAMNRCAELPVEVRAVCEARQMDTLEQRPTPILPDRREAPRPDEDRPQTGDQFNGPQTFTGDENGSPAF